MAGHRPLFTSARCSTLISTMKRSLSIAMTSLPWAYLSRRWASFSGSWVLKEVQARKWLNDSSIRYRTVYQTWTSKKCRIWPRMIKRWSSIVSCNNQGATQSMWTESKPIWRPSLTAAKTIKTNTIHWWMTRTIASSVYTCFDRIRTF